MSHAFVSAETLRPLMDKMDSYIRTTEKENEADRLKLILRYTNGKLKWWSWLPWMNVERAKKLADGWFDNNLRSKSVQKYYNRLDNIEDAQLILMRIRQLLLASKDETLLISDRHLDFLKNCNWRRL